MSVHLSAFVNFQNIFIRYRSRHRTLELSVMATEKVSTTMFFPVKKIFLWNKNLNKLYKCLLKTYTLNTYSTQVSFHVAVWPLWLRWHNLHLSLHVS